MPKRTVPVVGAVPGRGPPTKTVPGLQDDATYKARSEAADKGEIDRGILGGQYYEGTSG